MISDQYLLYLRNLPEKVQEYALYWKLKSERERKQRGSPRRRPAASIAVATSGYSERREKQRIRARKGRTPTPPFGLLDPEDVETLDEAKLVWAED